MHNIGGSTEHAEMKHRSATTHLALGANHGRALSNAAQSLSQVSAATDEGHLQRNCSRRKTSRRCILLPGIQFCSCKRTESSSCSCRAPEGCPPARASFPSPAAPAP